MVSEVVFGVLIGIILAPFIELAIALLVANQSKRRKFDTPPLKSTIQPTPDQQVIMDDSYHTCRDLAWLNLALQRYYMELARSDAYKNKLVKNMLSKVKIKNRIIKDIRVENLDLGKECPVIKSVTSLRLCEYEEIIRNKSAANKEKELLEEMEKETELINKQSEILKEDNESVNTSYSEEDNTRDDLSNVTNDDIIDNGNYQQCYFLFEVYYNGSVNFDLTVDLLKGYSLPISGAIHGFQGKVILRLPAKDYNTRFEYSFIGDPNFQIQIESGLSADNENLFMAKTISSLSKKIFRFTLHTMLVFPNWYSHYLPQVTPSLRAINHSFTRVNAANFINPVKKLCDEIKIYLSMDYKITSVRDGIVFRRINYFINGDDRIYCTHYEIPPNAFRNCVRSVPPGTVHLDDLTHSSNTARFSMLNSEDAEVLGLFYTLRALHGVFSQFRGLREIRRISDHVSLVVLNFINHTYEFVRIIHDNLLIFHRNSSTLPEFFVFKIYASQLFVYQYCITDNLRFNSIRIRKLKDRMDNKSFKTLGSSGLFRFMAYSRAKARRYFGTENEISHDNYNPYALDSIEDVFDRLKTGFENGWINDEEVHQTTVRYNKNLDMLSAVISRHSVRMRLFCEACVINPPIAMNERIEYFSVDEVSSIPQEYVLYSYTNIKDKDSIRNDITIIDTEIDKKGYMQGFVLDEEGNDKCALTIYYNQVRSRNLLSNFFFAIEQRMNLEEYLIEAREAQVLQFVYKKRFVKELICLEGTFFFEFYTEEEDDFYFYLYDKTQGKYIIDKIKVITGGICKPNRVVINVAERTVLQVSIQPKTYRNRTLSYRIYQGVGNWLNDTLVDFRIGMKKKEKYACCFIVPKDVTVFWEVGGEGDVEVLLNDGEATVGINGNGMVVSKGAAYTISYKNYGEKKRNVKIYFGCALLK
ncbi:hypothetical protein TCON_1168 [Astathelohania contejeani]|uniref:SMP-LTD domain-containing protein n=1 Tax=Astathelohania contejeani TaxID=164912 RepID=A0ABQ7HZP4_9MICR|nr:hypothetical protein TCON_1168 [Thelohania contejeani]